MFKDNLCTCVSYCDCVYPPGTPCECEGMLKDPHCMYCCNHLTEEQEAKWRKELDEPVSSCCGTVMEERVLQTYMSETILHICLACGKNCQPVPPLREY
jgi:hypothetical protein